MTWISGVRNTAEAATKIYFEIGGVLTLYQLIRYKHCQRQCQTMSETAYKVTKKNFLTNQQCLTLLMPCQRCFRHCWFRISGASDCTDTNKTLLIQTEKLLKLATHWRYCRQQKYSPKNCIRSAWTPLINVFLNYLREIWSRFETNLGYDSAA
jgi:hypothetical protein